MEAEKICFKATRKYQPLAPVVCMYYTSHVEALSPNFVIIKYKQKTPASLKMCHKKSHLSLRQLLSYLIKRRIYVMIFEHFNIKISHFF